jgi:poly(hydroxyalkanoate) depolymerase family esterase
MPRRRRPSRALRSGLRALLPPVLPPRPRIRRPVVVPVPRPRRPRPPRPGRWVPDVHHGPSGGRAFDVYLPAGPRRRARVPAVVLLHGCRQTPAEFADATRFVQAADRGGFVLVAPHQQGRHHPQRCWRWYEAAHQHRGAGEPGILAGIIGQVVAEQTRWRVDPRRVYAAGLSAGGAMALTLAAVYPDLVAAVGVHSAPAYRSASRAGQALAAMGGRTVVPEPGTGLPMAPAIVVQGSADRVVQARNGDRIADQWLRFRSAATGRDGPGRSRTTTGRSPDGRAWTTVRWYGARGRKVLEYWRVEGLGHAWSGGRAGGSFSDPAGPRAASLMWQFFRLHRL